MSGSIIVGMHAFLGEAGALAFLWVLVERLSPDKKRLKRANVVSILGVVFLFFSWFLGGFHYLGEYGSDVKPVIKESSVNWGHNVVTETKEHVFLFLPILGMLGAMTVFKFGEGIAKDKKLHKASLFLYGTIVLIAFLMAFFGYIISTSFRVAITSGVA